MKTDAVASIFVCHLVLLSLLVFFFHPVAVSLPLSDLFILVGLWALNEFFLAVTRGCVDMKGFKKVSERKEEGKRPGYSGGVI